MLKLKDIVWGEIDYSDETVAEEEFKDDLDLNGWNTIAMCCGGGNGGIPPITLICGPFGR